LPLTITTLAIVSAALALPYTRLATTFGLEPLPIRYFAFLFVAVTTYLALVEAVKERVLRRLLPNS
jgi:Mg2+-importing ATPase